MSTSKGKATVAGSYGNARRTLRAPRRGSGVRGRSRRRADSIVEVLKLLAPVVDLGQPMLTIAGDPLQVLTPTGTPGPAVGRSWSSGQAADAEASA